MQQRPANRSGQTARAGGAQRPAGAARAPQRPAQQAPKRPAGGGSNLPRNLLILVLAVLVTVGAFFLQFKVFPDGRMLVNKETGNAKQTVEISGSSPFQFTEIMSVNGSTLMDANMQYSDWIELTNGSSVSMNVEGFTIAQEANAMKQFVFPDLTLDPGECVIVFCDNKLQNTADAEFHAPFKLSGSGTTVILFNPSGAAVEAVNVPSMESNESYAKSEAGTWQVTDEYTPGMANTPANHRTLVDNTATVESDVIVTEFMASNASYVPDENGAYADWIEITNNGSQSVSLNGYGLSDSRNKPVKWKFPDVTIGPGQRIIVYCDSKNLAPTDGSPLHASFNLSTEKESVLFTNAAGQLITCVDYDLLKTDQSMSLQADGTWTTGLAPTPGYSNTKDSAALIEGQFAAQNTSGVFITEVMASTDKANYSSASYDWAELYNASANTVNLSGMGLSDDPAKPRKWQFPEGMTIAPGQYIALYLSGLNSTSYDSGKLCHTNFSIAADGYEEVVLSTQEGKILDRVPMPLQYSNISYGRISGQQGFFYFTEATAMAANAGNGYRSRALAAQCSVPGGLYESGRQLTVELTCESGGRIYYTTDSTDPTEYSTPYTGPITISDTTVLRSAVYASESLPSLIKTETYFFGLNHTMEVVSIISDPDNLFSAERGIYIKDPASDPAKKHEGWRDTEVDANVEIFTLEGETLVSQGCGFRLHGQDSRAADEKGFKVIARSKYGDNRFRAALFDNRPFTEYQSFLLRPSGEDWNDTHMKDSILTALARNTSIMYQDTKPCVLYINGEYWGQYYLRERVNPYMICQHEGWEGQEDDIDLVKANSLLVQGSNESFAQLLEWLSENKVDTDEKLRYVDSIVDVRNYMEYVALQIYTGNTDTLNVRRYRNTNADGRWRWVLFDMDWAFVLDNDMPRRWLNPAGTGVKNRTNNKLFIGLMQNETFFDEYLTFMGQMLATDWSTESVVADIRARYELLAPEMPMQLTRWGVPESQYIKSVQKFVAYAETRPTKLLGYMKEAYKLTDEQMQHYFGDAMAKIEEYQRAKSGGGE